MFWTSRLSFDVDIFDIFKLGNCFGYFSKTYQFFFKFSGHPDIKWGARYLLGEDLEVIWADFSTVS